IDSLPEELGDLQDLVCLDLSGCDNLKILPDAVGKLHFLKCLMLDESGPRVELPQNKSVFTKLKFLELQLIDVKNLPAEMPYRCIQLQKL
ncbi:unnamed protein product, partial [Sphagnum compactum]